MSNKIMETAIAKVLSKELPIIRESASWSRTMFRNTRWNNAQVTEAKLLLVCKASRSFDDGYNFTN